MQLYIYISRCLQKAEWVSGAANTITLRVFFHNPAWSFCTQQKWLLSESYMQLHGNRIAKLTENTRQPI